MRFLPLVPSCWGFSFARGCGVSFFGGIQHSPVDGCSAANCSFGVIPGEDECMSFCSTICCHRTIQQLLNVLLQGLLPQFFFFANVVLLLLCLHQTSRDSSLERLISQQTLSHRLMAIKGIGILSPLEILKYQPCFQAQSLCVGLFMI